MQTSDLEKKVAAFIAARDAKAEITSAYKDGIAELDQTMDEIKRELLEAAKELNVDSMKTAAGTFYRQTKTRYWASDWEAMHAFVLQTARPDFLEKRLNQTAVKEFLDENPDVELPGLRADSEYVVNVRRA